ncbi:MAG: hypothetical protein V4537_12945 [Pseudomonadota bacterium]
MRSLSLIAALPLLALTACGGASGPQSVGSNAAPAGNTSGGAGGGVSTPTPTPTPASTPAPSPAPTPAPTPAPSPTPTPASGGAGGGVGGGTSTPTPTPTPTSFLQVTAAKTMDAVGTFQSLETTATSTGVLYRANASTVRAPSGTITYNPRDGVFTLNIADTIAGVNATATRFQDPAHNTDFDNFRTPEWGVPEFAGFNYVEAGSTETTVSEAGVRSTKTDALTFFYQRPGGATTYYVSLAGFVRNQTDANGFGTFQRGVMVFGDQTLRTQIPATGTGTYQGGFLASMIGNTTGDSANPNPNFFQWIAGNSTTSIDFSKQTMSLYLIGKVGSANMNGYNIADSRLSYPTGSTFEAQGSGTIDLNRTGGFTGSFAGAGNYVRFVTPTGTQTVNVTGITQGSNVAGASSIDGTFFGPNAVNVGGNWRVVGGTPDQRVDIHGAFTGAKQ